ncbi:MAG: PKD domain-containing protein [Bacteroidetes bacterium]|nr:PKD domain-containing protein [Bacteroidota bacterium]
MKKVLIQTLSLIILTLCLVINGNAADRYWVGGKGDWDGTAGSKWASTSGGSGGASIPSDTDNVYFDGNSGNDTITVNGTDGICLSLDFIGFKGIFANKSGFSLKIYGSFTVAPSMTYINYSTIRFLAKSGVNNITTNGVSIPNTFSFEGDTSAIWRLQDNLVLSSSSQTLLLSRGTFDANNFNVTLSGFISSNSSHRIINMGSGTWTLTGFGIGTNPVWDLTNSTNLKLNAGSSTIKVIDSSGEADLFFGSNQTYNNFWNATTGTGFCYTATVIGSPTSVTFNDFKIDAGRIQTFQTASTTKINTLTAIGTCSNHIIINTNSTGYTLSKPSGLINVSYCDILFCTATGGATWNAVNSIDKGKDSGWIFKASSNIAFDASSGAKSTGTTSLSWSHTVCGFNPTLIVGIVIKENVDLVTGVTYDSVSMTRVDRQVMNALDGTGYMYILPNCSTGTHNIVVSLSSSKNIIASAVSYTGTSSTQPDSKSKSETTGGGNNNLSNTTSTTVVASNCWLVGVGFHEDANSSGLNNITSNKTDRMRQGAKFYNPSDFNIVSFDSDTIISTGSQSSIVSSNVHVYEVGQILISLKPYSPCTTTYDTLTRVACVSFTLNAKTYTATGTYNDTLTNAGGCDSIITLHLTINPLPKAKAGIGTAICAGDSIQIGDSAKTNCTYSWSATSGWSANIAMPYVSPFKTNHYTLKVKDTITGCSNQDTVTIYIIPKPSRPKVANNNGTLCEGDTLKLWCDTVKGASIYTWDGPKGQVLKGQYAAKANSDSNDVGLWGVTVTVNGCTSAHRYTYLYINAKPIVSISGSKTVCSGSTKTYTAGSTGNTYIWSVNGGSISSGSGTSSISIFWGAAGKGSVKLIEKNSKGCRDSIVDSITINALPLATVGASQSVCAGTSTKIGGATTTGHSYVWTSNPKGFASNIANPTLYPSATATYYLTEIDTNTGCSKKDSVIITINPSPKAILGNDSVICMYDTVHLGGASVSGNTYSWTSKPPRFKSTLSNPRDTPFVNTVYYLTETNNATSCSKTDSIKVTVNPKPSIRLIMPSYACEGSIVNFYDSTSLSAKRIWYFGDGDTSTAVAPSHLYKKGCMCPLKLIVYSNKGCSSTTSPFFDVRNKPNADWTAKQTGSRSYDFATKNKFYPTNNHSWDLGDGMTWKGYTISHTYTKDSTYKVSLQVTYNGCINTKDSVLSVVTGIASIRENNFSVKISPNPFKEQTQIHYILSQNNHVKIYVTDVLGRTISTLTNAIQNAGDYSVNFTAPKAGIYFVRIQVGDEVVVKKVVMVK